ncbi:hypothetical protein [Terribacillus sp. JSM ZJ617]|uniref:hypothetical protein n=1 Tax=Terribacillus sp. JSM ZJ617 TaxID=3342119 RepID=UPI0035A89A77
MNIVREAAKSDYPDYRIVNITGAGFPIHKKTVVCLATIQKGLPVVMDFTLKLLNLGLTTDKISELLSIDEELINNAYYDLDQNNMYDIKLKRLTDDGLKYINSNKYESLQRIELPVAIDGFTSFVSKSKNYISNKNAKELNLNTIEPIIKKKNNDVIRGGTIKKVLKDYILENNMENEGELVEIVKVIDKPTEYRQMYIVVLEGPDSKCKLAVYDRNIKNNYIEAEITTADKMGIKFFSDNSIDFFVENIKQNISAFNCPSDEIQNIIDVNFFNEDYNHIYFEIPMIEAYELNSDWINELERYLKRGYRVKISFNGPKYPTTYIRNRTFDIILLSHKYDNLEISHNIEYRYAATIFNKTLGFVDGIQKYDLPLVHNPYCLSQNIHKLTQHEIDTIYLTNTDLELNFIDSTRDLNEKVKEMIKLAKSLNIEMEDYYGVGWLDNGEFLNEYSLNDLKLATNSSNFSDFTKKLNASMIEVIEKIGQEYGISEYLYNDFKKNYPILFNALERLKVYRNSMQHNDLNTANRKKYLELISLDLGNSFPEFHSNGYKILQTAIIEGIIKAIRETTETIKLASDIY